MVLAPTTVEAVTRSTPRAAPMYEVVALPDASAFASRTFRFGPLMAKRIGVPPGFGTLLSVAVKPAVEPVAGLVEPDAVSASDGAVEGGALPAHRPVPARSIAVEMVT
jgi:hypothetical protein